MNGWGKIHLGNGIYVETTGFTDIVIDGVYQSVDATNLNSQGVELYNQQKYSEALICYEGAINLIPTNKIYIENKILTQFNLYISRPPFDILPNNLTKK
jgi:hypothetical protein